jgi:hypothetical protein
MVRAPEARPRAGPPELADVSREDYLAAMKERAPHILERWADAGARFKSDNRKTHAVRGFFGIGSFGVNAFEAHEGELLVVPHGRWPSRRGLLTSDLGLRLALLGEFL